MKAFGKTVAFLLVWWYSAWLYCAFQLALLVAIGKCLYDLVRGATRTTRWIEHSQDDVVVITDCDSPIGYAVANHLRQTFAVIGTVLDIESPTAEALRAHGIQVVQADLSEPNGALAAFADITPLLGNRRLHALIHNADMSVNMDLDLLGDDEIQRMVQVNLMTPIQLTRRFLPSLKHFGARVINMTSLNSELYAPSQSVYAATKLGLNGFSEVLDSEYRKSGVPVITIRLGDFSYVRSYGRIAGNEAVGWNEENVTRVWRRLNAVQKTRMADRFVAMTQQIRHCYRYIRDMNAGDFERICKAFDDALLSSHPKSRYDVASTLSIIINTLVSVLPRCLLLKLVPRDPLDETLAVMRIREIR